MTRALPLTPVVLSGMGSDGTTGLAAIKEHLGTALVQEPADAGAAGGAGPQGSRRRLHLRDRSRRRGLRSRAERAPVLLVGETGTGKNILAERIHARGPRRHRPFVVVNAAAIPAALLDSELFGHVAGAFTGATRARRGLIAEADGGTILLDEIADLPVELQSRLLRVVETGLIRAVGADQERAVDVRFLAAAHVDLVHAVRERAFREDLYFRLNALAIGVPALRDRREDVPALVDYFFERARARNPRSPVQELAPAVRAQLVGAPWPGNVRELQGFVERLVVLGKNARVEARDADMPTHLPADAVPGHAGTIESLRAMSTRHVESVLAHTNGDKPRAAAILGVDVSTLYRWRRQRPDG